MTLKHRAPTSKDPKAPPRVLVVEPLGPLRDGLRMSLRERGIQEVEYRSTLADAWAYLEGEPLAPDWIIVCHKDDGEVHLLHLLAMMLETPAFHATRVSLFFPEGLTGNLVPAAFELGLLSCHSLKGRSTESIGAEIGQFLQTLDTHNQDTCAAAAGYYRKYLKERKLFDQLVLFERLFSVVYAKSAAPLVFLAEALFLAGDFDKALSTVLQVKFMAPSVAERVDALCARFRDGLKSPDSKQPDAVAGIFELHSCLVAESDETLHKPIADALNHIGVTVVRFETEFGGAMRWLAANPEPGLVIQEWKLPGGSGSALVQRIRHLNFHKVPVVVLSSLVKSAQLPFLRELGVTGVIEKPFVREQFLQKLVAMLRLSHMPRGYKSMERKIVAALGSGNLEEARVLKAAFLGGKAEVPERSRVLVEARFALSDGETHKAHALLTALLAKEPDDLSLLDLLGKVLLKMGDCEAAIVCFNRAQVAAPDNIDRLCCISDSLVELGEFERAEAAIMVASTIDENSPRIAESRARADLASGQMTDSVRAAFSADAVPLSLLAYMNNRAVAYAKSGRHAHGISLYNEVLAVLHPTAQREVRAMVLYNLGLAHIRNSDPATARAPLLECQLFADSRLRVKCERLLAKVAAAVENGTLLSVDNKENVTDASKAKPGPEAGAGGFPPSNLSLPPGSHFCYGLVGTWIEGDDDLAGLGDALPAFKRREGLSRGATSKRKASYK